MKKIVIMCLFVLLALSLTACYDERGYAYKSLNEYDPGKVHVSYSDNDSVLNNTPTEGIGGNYDHLNDNLCRSSPHCCGDFTPDEVWFRDMEQRAIVENNSVFCVSIPDTDLIVDCPSEESYIYYSKQRCLDNFLEQ